MFKHDENFDLPKPKKQAVIVFHEKCMSLSNVVYEKNNEMNLYIRVGIRWRYNLST